MEEKLTSSADIASEPQYVGFWARFLAMLIDSVWLTLILIPIVFLLFGQDFMSAAMMTSENSAEMAATTGASAAGGMLVQLLLPALLVVAFWVYKSATPGKMVVSAEIVDEKSLGKPSTGQLIVRYIGYYISSFIFGLGFLWIAFDKRKQGWHDKIAGTLVVRR